jgi:hypothetical protein
MAGRALVGGSPLGRPSPRGSPSIVKERREPSGDEAATSRTIREPEQTLFPADVFYEATARRVGGVEPGRAFRLARRELRLNRARLRLTRPAARLTRRKARLLRVACCPTRPTARLTGTSPRLRRRTLRPGRRASGLPRRASPPARRVSRLAGMAARLTGREAHERGRGGQGDWTERGPGPYKGDVARKLPERAAAMVQGRSLTTDGRRRELRRGRGGALESPPKHPPPPIRNDPGRSSWTIRSHRPARADLLRRLKD